MAPASQAAAVPEQLADPMLELLRSHQQDLGSWLGRLEQRLDRAELREAATAGDVQALRADLAATRKLLEQLVRSLGAEITGDIPAGASER